MNSPAALDLSVLSVSYNAEDLLRKCLKAVFANTREVGFEVIVVDNDSRYADIVGMVKREFPQVTTISNDHNGGFSQGNNLGLRKARGRYVVLLNPDTEVQPFALDKMVRFMDRRPDVGVLGSPLVYPGGRDQGVSGRAFPSPLSFFFGRSTLLTRLFPSNRFSRKLKIQNASERQEPLEVDWVSGACMMVRLRAVEQVGLLDEGFFMYWEDADWCFRMKQAGWKVLCYHEANVVHQSGGSSKARPRLIVAFHKSAYRYYRKHIVPTRFHPMHLVAAAGLAGRSCLLVFLEVIKSLRPDTFLARRRRKETPR
jgi:GT2 family glycosyltransferase